MAEVGSLFVRIASVFDKKGVEAATRGMKNLRGWVDRNRAQFKKMAIAGAAMGAALVAGALKAAKMAGVQEMAELKLAKALEQTGDQTGVTLEELKDYASQLQKTTTIGDETSLAVMQLGLNMGINADEIKDATKQSIGLSKAYGIDLKASMKMVALARQGEFSMLARYIPQLRSTTDKTEQAAIANEAMAKGFGIAEKETETYAGKLEQLGNRWGDIVENIGFKVIPIIMKLVGVIERNVLPLLESWTKRSDDTSGAGEKLAKVFQFVIKVIVGISAAFNIAGTGLAALFAAMTGNFDVAKEGWKDMKNQIESYGEKLRALSTEEIAVARTAAEEAIITEITKTEELNLMAEEQIMIEQERYQQRIAWIMGLTDFSIKERERALKDERKKHAIGTKEYAAYTAALVKLDKERAATGIKLKQEVKSITLSGLKKIEMAEKLTARVVTSAIKEALKERLRIWILENVAEVIAAKIKALAIAIMNTKITFGVAAGQIGGVLAAAAAGIAGLRALPSLDMPGIVPGPPGKPILVQALGGERFGGRESIGAPNGITVIFKDNIIANEESLEDVAEKVEEVLDRKLKANRITG